MSSIANLSEFIDQPLPPVPPVTQINTEPLTVVKDEASEINIHNILQIQPPVLPLSVVKTEPLTMAKNEPPEFEFIEVSMDDIPVSSGEEINRDIKNIDISQVLSEDLIKHETVSKDIDESKYSESVETQVIVKTENAPFIKIENITENEILIETDEDTSNENANKGTGQGIVEIQDLNGHFNALGNLEIDEKFVLNSSNDLNGISIKTDFAEPGTSEITLLKAYKEKVKVIEAPVIPVETHEYISIAKDKHVCNYCQYSAKNKCKIRYHITRVHRKVHTMYLCSYCPFKSKWKTSLQNHIIVQHKDIKVYDVHWFKCHLCDAKFRFEALLKKHMATHVQDRLKLCPVCGKGFKAEFHVLRHVRKVHNKESVNRYKCPECEYTTINKKYIKPHIETHHMEIMHQCNECDYKTRYLKMLKRHKRTHETRYRCDKCHYKSYSYQEFYRHKLRHLKREDMYCYHCPYKSNRKDHLKIHILRHFKKGEVTFHCYICDFTTLRRRLITGHIKKHSEVQSKPEISEGS